MHRRAVQASGVGLLLLCVCGVQAIAVGCVGDEPGDTPNTDGGGGVDTGAPSDGAASPDTGSDAGGGGDADADAAPPACDQSKPFGNPTLVPGVNTAYDEYGARLSSDELTIYVSSSILDAGFGGTNLYSATRASKQDPFGPLSLMANVNDDPSERFPTVTEDGLTLLFDRDNADIFVATRGNKLSSFGMPALAAGLNSAFNDAQPFLLPDGKTVYFISGRYSNTNADIYRATLGASGTFDTPELLANVNKLVGGAEANDDMPVVTPDELILFFASARAEGGAKGGRDIWMARRSSKAVAFGAPTNVLELNTADEDFPTWVSADGCTLVFASYGRVDAGVGGADMWMATRPR